MARRGDKATGAAAEALPIAGNAVAVRLAARALAIGLAGGFAVSLVVRLLRWWLIEGRPGPVAEAMSLAGGISFAIVGGVVTVLVALIRDPRVPGHVQEMVYQYRGVAAFVLVFILGCIYTPRVGGTGVPVFLTWQTQRDILFEYCEYGLLATGMTLVILTGGIDLSVSSVLGFCATLFCLLTIGYGWAAPLAVLAVAVCGLLAGAVNGALVAGFRLQPFVATLAMMTAARGLAKFVSGGIKVMPGAQPWYRITEDTPAFFSWMTRTVKGIGLQPATLIFLATILLVAYVTWRSTYGRRIYSIGGNEEAARLCGIAVWRTKLGTYALCGLFAAVAGIINACKQDLGDPEAGTGYELDAIAAVVIGGTNLAGGRGGVMFTLLGVLIIAYINKILSLNAVRIDQRMMTQAAIIVAECSFSSCAEGDRHEDLGVRVGAWLCDACRLQRAGGEACGKGVGRWRCRSVR